MKKKALGLDKVEEIIILNPGEEYKNIAEDNYCVTLPRLPSLFEISHIVGYLEK